MMIDKILWNFDANIASRTDDARHDIGLYRARKARGYDWRHVPTPRLASGGQTHKTLSAITCTNSAKRVQRSTLAKNPNGEFLVCFIFWSQLPNQPTGRTDPCESTSKGTSPHRTCKLLISLYFFADCKFLHMYHINWVFEENKFSYDHGVCWWPELRWERESDSNENKLN